MEDADARGPLALRIQGPLVAELHLVLGNAGPGKAMNARLLRTVTGRGLDEG